MTNSSDQPTTEAKSFGVRVNLWLLGFTRNWLRFVLVILGTYATLPLVAPTLMAVGATAPANVIYTVYGPMCHQFAFRSIFLFGEQAFYPRAIADTDLRPYEVYAADIPELTVGASPDDFSPSFWLPARQFRGNEQMGYKTAICARDVMIYLAMFGGGLIYAIPYVRRRIRPLPLLLYAVIGLGPIGLDGFSQLLSYEPLMLWPTRETEPFFRLATGAMFGLANAWLIFPHFAQAMRETREEIEVKFLRAGKGHLL